MEADPRASRGRSHGSERPRSKHRAPSPLPRRLPGPRSGDWSEERRPGPPEPPGGRGPSLPRAAGAPWMPAVHPRAPALAPEAPRRPAEGRLAASPDRPLGAPQGRGEHPPSHKDHPPLGAQAPEEPSAGSTQRPRPASAREQSPRPLCREGTAGKLSSRGAQKGKERGGRSSQKPKPPSRVASHNPDKKRKRSHSGESRSHKGERRPHGFDAREGPGGLPRKAGEKVGDNTQTPEGKVRTPPLGRQPAGPRPEMEAAAAEEKEELDPPTMSFGASFTHRQPPSQEASGHPVKRPKHKHSRKSPSDKDKQRLHGSDAGSGAGVLPPKVREKVGNSLKAPEGKVKTPHLGRKPAVPRLEEEEEFQPPTMSFQAEVTYHPRPSQVASDRLTLPWLAGAPGMSGAPSEVASENPMKNRKRKHSSQSQSHKDQQRLQGSDAGEGPGGLLPKVREKVGDACKTPEGKVKTPHLGRQPACPPPEVEEELDPPIMSSQASLTPHQPPARKESKSVKPPTTALGGKRLRKEDTTSAQAEAGQSEKPFPPAAAGARLTQVPPAATPAWPDLGPCRGQPSDPPPPAFASMSSFQPRPRAPPSPGEEEGAGLMGIRLNSGTQAFSGSNRARRRKMITMLQQCVQTLQHRVTLLSQERGVPYSLLQPAVESCTPEQLPRLGEHHGAPAAETDPLGKKQCHRALEKDRREEHTPQLQPQEQEVPELGLHISANRPQDPPANMAFADSSERGGAAAVQEKALPAPGTRAPSHPASGHSSRPIPGKQVVSSHKKPVKKIAPLMAKSIKDYKTRCYRR